MEYAHTQIKDVLKQWFFSPSKLQKEKYVSLLSKVELGGLHPIICTTKGVNYTDY
jgi:hypothetical protein